MHTGVTQCWDGKYLRAVEGHKSVATGEARKIKITICQTESNSNGCANCLRRKESLCGCPLTFVQRRSRDGGLEEESPTAPSLYPRKILSEAKFKPRRAGGARSLSRLPDQCVTRRPWLRTLAPTTLPGQLFPTARASRVSDIPRPLLQSVPHASWSRCVSPLVTQQCASILRTSTW